MSTKTSPIKKCSICREPVLDRVQGVCKRDEGVVHMKCQVEGVPPEPIEMRFDPGLPHKDNIYNCGHVIYGPFEVVPPECPDCGTPLIQLYLDEM